jgi:hypothetical protein
MLVVCPDRATVARCGVPCSCLCLRLALVGSCFFSPSASSSLSYLHPVMVLCTWKICDALKVELQHHGVRHCVALSLSAQVQLAVSCPSLPKNNQLARCPPPRPSAARSPLHRTTPTLSSHHARAATATMCTDDLLLVAHSHDCAAHHSSSWLSHRRHRSTASSGTQAVASWLQCQPTTSLRCTECARPLHSRWRRRWSSRSTPT